MQKERLFTNRQLLTLLWPLIIEQMLEILVGMADTVMVSSVGEAAISGVSLVDMINQLIITLFGALATGGAVVTSQHLGAKRPEDAAKSAGQLVGPERDPRRRRGGVLPYHPHGAAAAFLWHHHRRGHAGVPDLLYDHGAVVSVFGALQRGCGHLPLHGQQRGVDEGLSHRQRYQLLRQRALRVRAENGCRGRCRAHADLPRCRCVHHSGAGRAAGLPAAHHAAVCHPL